MLYYVCATLFEVYLDPIHIVTKLIFDSINLSLDLYASSTSSDDGGNKVTGADEEEDYPVKDKLHLFSELSEIGDWDSLCTFLGVKDSKMNALKVSTKAETNKKQDCLTSYYDSGNANWETVVMVVAQFPFENVKLACNIAKKRMDMGYRQCTKNLEKWKDEL